MERRGERKGEVPGGVGRSNIHLPEGRARRRPRVMSLRAVGILVYTFAKPTIEH